LKEDNVKKGISKKIKIVKKGGKLLPPSGAGGDYPTNSTWVNASKFSINIPELTSMWRRYFHILFKTEIR
jgi:hypothetical protein